MTASKPARGRRIAVYVALIPLCALLALPGAIGMVQAIRILLGCDHAAGYSTGGARAGGVDQSVVHHAVGRYADLRDDHIRGIGDYGSQSREITAIVTLATTLNAGAPVGRSAHAPSPAHAADRWGTAR